MKLVSLNIEGASQGKILYDYLGEQSHTADIFCLQEVYSAGEGAPRMHAKRHMFGYEELKKLLHGFVPFFEEKSLGYTDKKVEWPIKFGMAIFVRNNFNIKNCAGKIIGNADVPGSTPLEGLVKIQILTLESGAGIIHVLNMHGMSRPGDKLDTPERLLQSQRLLEIINALPKAPIVLSGDFNLMPETESIRMLESKLTNLIKTFKITNTRNEVSWKRYNNRQSYADFTFISPEIKVKSFEVPYNLVSDHLPMLLDFSL